MPEYDYSTYDGSRMEILAEFDWDRDNAPGEFIVEYWVYRYGWKEDKTFASEDAAVKYARKKAKKNRNRYRVLKPAPEERA